ncbi:MAG: potassium channel family protein, partial [Planctomycetota bacterium]
LLFLLYRGAARAIGCPFGQVGLLFVVLVLYSATGYMYFELPANPDLRWVDAFWWSIVTMTTVGYGDFFPGSVLGRVLIGFPTMLLGIGILGYMLSLVATAMVESRIKEMKGMKDLVLAEHVVICNFGTLEKTRKLVHELRRDESTREADIVIVDDSIEELPPELQAEKVHFVKGDPSREPVLEKAKIRNSKAVIIQARTDDLVNSDNHNLKIGLTIESICPATFSVAEGVNPENEIFFRRANCDGVVCIASLAGQMLVQELQDPGMGAIVSELTSNAHGKQFYVTEIKEPAESYKDLLGKYDKHEATLLGVRRGRENFILPGPDFRIHAGDRAILIASGRPS